MKTLSINLFALVFATTLFVSCEKDAITGDGNIVTRTLQVDDFTGINFAEAGTIILKQGPEQSVVATGHSNIISKIDTDVDGDQWKIDFENNRKYDDYELTIEITLPKLDQVHLSGAGDITLDDFYDQGDLDLKISGSGSITLNEFTGISHLDIDVSGSGVLEAKKVISGLNSVDINYRGSGKYDGMLIQSKEYDINISGSADCFVYAIEKLNVKISGSGVISYKGNPTIDEKITGSGSIVDIN